MTVPSPDGQRIPPVLPAHHMKTYQVLAPLNTHWRKATCAEFGCDKYLNGWFSIFAADSPQAEYIRHDKTRRHVEERLDGGLAKFTFEAGQEFFAGSPEHDHRVLTGRPERLIVRGGDWRGNPRGEVREHVSAEDWVDDFATHQDRLAQQAQKG